MDSIQKYIHTNNIERIWRSLRASISHLRRSLPKHKVQSFLDTFQFELVFDKEARDGVLLQIIIALHR